MDFLKTGVASYLSLVAITLIPGICFAHSNDPLTAAEIATVSAITAPRPVAARLTSQKDATQSNASSLEVLLVERHAEKGAPQGQRRADIFTYDYATNELIESVVDLNTSEVLRSIRVQGTQLPLTENELKRAKKIVFDDEDERQILEHEYYRITSHQLTDTSELFIKAFTFTSDSLPNRVNEASKQCGIHRCAQLMLYTGENIVFEVSPIVNLSEGVVTQRIGF